MLAGQAFEWLTVITLQSPSFLVVIGKSVGREWFAPRLSGARDAGGATRATTSHGVRRTTRRLESLRTTALSTAKLAADAVELAAATAHLSIRHLPVLPAGAEERYRCVSHSRLRIAYVRVSDRVPSAFVQASSIRPSSRWLHRSATTSSGWSSPR